MKYNLNGQGIITLPGSKSIAIRTLIIASYLNTPLKISNFPTSEDALTLLNALQELGFKCLIEEDQVVVSPPEQINLEPEIEIRDSAAALRFLIFRLAGWSGMKARIRISQQLQKRPLDPLFKIIEAMGGSIFREGEMIRIRGRSALSFTPQTEKLLVENASLSSQFLSGILLSIPLLAKGIDLLLSAEQVSKPYIDLTLETMRAFGIEFQKEGNRVIIAHQGYTNPQTFQIEEDLSSACYFWALGALSDKPVGIKAEQITSQQADLRFLDLLQRIGAEVMIDNNAITVRKRELRGIEVDMGDMPDQVPTLAVLALFASSPTGIKNIRHLRYKESDRISALVTELSRIGAELDYRDDILSIKPLQKEPQKNILHTYQDHRLVMAFSILTSIFPDLQLDSGEAVSKSFPGFFTQLEKVVKES